MSKWLKRAIDGLDTRRMSPEEQSYFTRVTASDTELVKVEQARIEEVKNRQFRKPSNEEKLRLKK